MYNINKFTIKDIIKQELLMFENRNFNYYGSEKQIENVNNILKSGINVLLLDNYDIWNDFIIIS